MTRPARRAHPARRSAQAGRPRPDALRPSWRAAGVAPVLLAAALGAASAQAGPLADLVRSARDSDPTYRAALRANEAGREGVLQARNLRLPTVNATVSGAHLHNEVRRSPSQSGYEAGSSDYPGGEWAVTVVQPVYNPAVRAAAAQADVRERQLDAERAFVEQELIARVAERYLQAAAAHEGLAVATAEVRALQQWVDRTERRQRAGLARQSELIDTRARLADARACQSEARARWIDALAGITELTGLQPPRLRLLDDSTPDPGSELPPRSPIRLALTPTAAQAPSEPPEAGDGPPAAMTTAAAPGAKITPPSAAPTAAPARRTPVPMPESGDGPAPAALPRTQGVAPAEATDMGAAMTTRTITATEAAASTAPNARAAERATAVPPPATPAGPDPDHPLLQVRRLAVAVAEAEARRQRGAGLPSLDATLRAGRNRSQGSLYGATSDIENAEFRLALTIPLYAGGIPSSREREAALQADRAREELIATERALQRGWYAARQRLEVAAERTAAMRQAVQAGREALREKQAAFDAGLAHQAAVLDARRELARMQGELARARYDSLLARLALRRQAGDLDEFEIDVLDALLQREVEVGLAADLAGG